MTLTEKVYEHIDRLEKENKRLEKYIDTLQVVHFTELQTEKAENARFRRALEFYANEENNLHKISFSIREFEHMSEVVKDNGEKARQALESER